MHGGCILFTSLSTLLGTGWGNRLPLDYKRVRISVPPPPLPAFGESRRNNELPGRDCLVVGRRGGGGCAVVARAFSHVEEGDTSRAEKKNDRRSSVSPLLGVLPRRANEVLDFVYSRKPLLPLPSFFLRSLTDSRLDVYVCVYVMAYVRMSVLSFFFYFCTSPRTFFPL